MTEPGRLAGWIDATGLPPGVRGGTACRLPLAGIAGTHGSADYGHPSADRGATVEYHRAQLRNVLRLPDEPMWLHQVHGADVLLLEPGVANVHTTRTGVIALQQAHLDEPIEADACIVRGGRRPAVVLTADCVPLLLAAADGSEMAAIHAGWRGLAAGVIATTIGLMDTPPAQLHAWIGPAIGLNAFEIGPEVRLQLLAADPGAEAAFVPGRGDRWHGDLALLARLQLQVCGLQAISGGHWCTHSDPQRLHSYRRDGAASGRMASLVWRVGEGG